MDIKKIMAAIPRRSFIEARGTTFKIQLGQKSASLMAPAKAALKKFPAKILRRLGSADQGPKAASGQAVPLEFRLMQKDDLCRALIGEGHQPFSLQGTIGSGAWMTWNGSVWASCERKKKVMWAFVHEIWHAILSAYNFRDVQEKSLREKLPEALLFPNPTMATAVRQLQPFDPASKEVHFALPEKVVEVIARHIDDRWRRIDIAPDEVLRARMLVSEPTQANVERWGRDFLRLRDVCGNAFVSPEAVLSGFYLPTSQFPDPMAIAHQAKPYFDACLAEEFIVECATANMLRPGLLHRRDPWMHAWLKTYLGPILD